MQHIVVLIDFTELCKTSTLQAAVIAQKSGARVTLLHIAEPQSRLMEDGIKDHMKPYSTIVENVGVLCAYVIGYGSFMDVIASEIELLEPDLVVTGTHGIQGIRQNLFGSNILALVKRVPNPTLVVQDVRSVKTDGIQKILFPIGAHEHFEGQIKQSAALALIFQAHITVYVVLKTNSGGGEATDANLIKTRQHFDQCGVAYTVVKEPPTVYSFGYGKQIDLYAEQNEMDIIVVMSSAASSSLMGDSDKEKILLNKTGIPVLCCNDRH